MWGFAQQAVKGKGNKCNIGNKTQDNKELCSRCLLNILLRLDVADLARAILGLFLVNQFINLTSQADAKG